LVPRSVVLIGGDPGIGKSTLLMQALGSIAGHGQIVLYVSGEESAEQIRARAERITAASERFLLLIENELDAILQTISQTQAVVVVVDSVQSLVDRSLESHPGSVSQVRHCAAVILDAIKKGTAACFLVGHVTKDGTIAGPKVLEHMVDTVISFEGDRGHPYRVLRGSKNRFGSVSEIGVFEMSDRGLVEVSNPSELFLAERPHGVSGSAVTALMEGTRPILAEIQALVSGPIPGQGRRTCLGIDAQRLALMVAVVEKRLGMALSDHDIFLNAVGGVRATEPAVDLAMAAALLSSACDRPIPGRTLVFGEIGLAGEVRRVSRAEARINEATRLGFTRIIMPQGNREAGSGFAGVAVEGIAQLKDLASALFTD
jgi:DNA repair protein RadA/Sms